MTNDTSNITPPPSQRVLREARLLDLHPSCLLTQNGWLRRGSPGTIDEMSEAVTFENGQLSPTEDLGRQLIHAQSFSEAPPKLAVSAHSFVKYCPRPLPCRLGQGGPDGLS